jgi:hypothetical protein
MSSASMIISQLKIDLVSWIARWFGQVVRIVQMKYNDPCTKDINGAMA